MSKNATEKKMPVCPLFILQNDKEIMCRSYVAGADCLINRFNSREHLQTQLNIFCGENYKKCEQYLSYMHFQWEED